MMKFQWTKFLSAVSLILVGLSAPPQSMAGETQDSGRETASLPTYKNWGLTNNSSIKSDISALEAWKIQEGNRNITVAVIDTGIDATHPLLKENLWKNPLSSESNYGWDFVTNSANPKDTHGHGTHVAGIIGALSDPKMGISGVSHKVSIMSLKYYSEGAKGTVNLANSIKAIEFAINNGAKIINMSGGGPDYSEEEYHALKKAEAAGILVVAAAGNESQNIDQPKNYYYPAAYGLSNIISVAATDIENRLLSSSNYGVGRVDVAAPGASILSTYPTQMSVPAGLNIGKILTTTFNNKPGAYSMSGTSQATAFVSGLAVLLMAQDPSLKPAEIKEIVIKTSDKIAALATKVRSGGKINALSALLSLKDRVTIQKRTIAAQDKNPGLK